MQRTAVAVGVVVVALGLSACGGTEKPQGSKSFCRAADRYNSELERQEERGKVDTERQIERVQVLVDTAPKAIVQQARVFLDALQRVEEDPSLKDDPEIRTAVEDVNRYANQACGVYDRRSGV